MNETILPGRYRHFKGNEYEVLCVAKHSETEEPMVVYRALYGAHDVWVRPASMWNETVERDGKRFRRFERITEKRLDCVSVETMRESDARTIEGGVSGTTLMHRAALGVYRAMQWYGRTVIAVGSGNNGGDGYALACILRTHGIDVRIVTLSDSRSADGAHFARRAEALGVPCSPYSPGAFHDGDIIVDCLLGTGFLGAVRERYAQAIAEINDAGAFVLSVDINSGMNGDTGEAEIAVRSDLTVTIGFVKTGLVSEHAGGYMKRLVCADIGIALCRKEKLICRDGEDGAAEAALPCPGWLDMLPIDVRDVPYAPC